MRGLSAHRVRRARYAVPAAAHAQHLPAPRRGKRAGAAGHLLRPLRAGEPAAPSNRQLRRLAREYEQTAKALMLHRRIELEELHLPVDACMALIREVMADWITKTSLERGWEPSNRLLQRFPLDVRILLQPHPTRKAG